jgi:hypothetical protein
MENQQMTALSVVALFPETRKQINDFSEQVINSVYDGKTNPLEVDYAFKCIEETAKTIREGIKKDVVSECEKYGDKPFEYKGAKSVQVNNRSTYDFSGCSMWNELKEQENAIAEKRKKLETILKTIQGEMADAESGEILNPAPCSNSKIIVYKL